MEEWCNRFGARMAPPVRAPHLAAGFSLIELIVALAILAMASSVALIGLSGGSGTKLAPFVAQLMSDLKQARTRAILSSRPVAVLLDSRSRSYRLDASPPVKLPAEIAIRIRSTDNDVASRLEFYPDGSSSGGTLTVTLGKASVVLDVEWLTGAVRQRAAAG